MKSQRISFATLYDSAYLSRGVALYQSLKRQCSQDFNMYVLALDYDTYSYMEEFDDINAITVENVIEEYPVLEILRRNRTHQEFCWTLSSFFTQFVMRKYTPDICVYVDSDVFFWNDPCILIDEMICQKKSVLITEHNYFYMYDKTYTSGKFCVQFVPFLNDLRGNEILEWWRKRCEEKCSYDRDGKTLGDQKYLDDWESRFEGSVYNCQNIGAGIAPWNCVKYTVDECDGNKVLVDRVSGLSGNLIFYHFHALKKLNKNCWYLSGYEIPDDFKNEVYDPYIKTINEIEKNIDENIRGNKTEYRMVDEYIFYPVPYMGAKHVTIRHTEKKANQYMVTISIDDAAEFAVDLYITPDGTLRIKGIEDSALLFKNLHEVIWRIQTVFLFKTEDIYSIYCHVMKALKDKQHIKLEWFMERPEDVLIEHPIYDKVELVEILSDDQYFLRKYIYEPK